MMNKEKTLKRRLIWLLLLVPLLGMTSVLFAHTEKAVNMDDNSTFSSGNAEMSYRLPEPPRPGGPLVVSYITTDRNDKNGMYIKPRNLMTIMVNKNNDIYVNNGVLKRTITMDDLKGLSKQFIQNPDNDDRLPVIEEYDPNMPEYGMLNTTIRHVISLQYDRSSSAQVISDIRYELQKAYNELRDEFCNGRFGKKYNNCSQSQQEFARAMYPMKISEALPVSYDSEGNLILKDVKSAGINDNQAKTNKANKDLRIRVNGNPARLYVSTVLFENENGTDVSKSESAPKQISLEDLNDYIDQAISDGTGIRKVRLMIHPDVIMGMVVDLKETLRYRMLLNIVHEAYKD